MAEGIEIRVTGLLRATNLRGGYPSSLVCTDQGLVVASSGESTGVDDTAAFASLFEDVVKRARRDLGFSAVDEVALLDPKRGRTVIRPLQLGGSPMLFLVVTVPRRATWRRNTNELCKALVAVLQPLVDGEAA